MLRFELGNLGDHKSIGGGVWEARLDFGPEYRLYFGKQTPDAVVLIVGGDKQSQRSNIEVARRPWAELLEATKHGKAN